MPNALASAWLPTPTIHLCTVVAHHRPTPGVVTVTLGGTDLAGLPDVGGDRFAYLLLPPTDGAELTVGHDFDWSTVRTLPKAQRPRGAYYTIRRQRLAAGEVDLDVVVHPGGVASRWAVDARIGDPAALWGPRRLFQPPPEAERILLVADDTGVPALLSILETLPAAAPPVHAIACVRSAAEIRPTTAIRDADHVEWTTTDLSASGTLLEEVPTPDYVWGGGERGWLDRIERRIEDAHDLGTDRRCLTAYWRAGQPAGLR